jgi:hypothetical protein
MVCTKASGALEKTAPKKMKQSTSSSRTHPPFEFYVILGGGAGLTRVGIQRLNRNKLDPKLHHQFTM